MGALPKRRISTARKGKRRIAMMDKNKNIIKCKACGADKLSHQACKECGNY